MTMDGQTARARQVLRALGVLLFCALGALWCTPLRAAGGGSATVYVLDCAGVLHVLRPGSMAPETRIDLATKTALIPRGNGTGGTVSACAIGSAVLLPGMRELAALAQTAADYDTDGGLRYNVLRFQLPDGQFAGKLPLTGSYQDPPRLQLGTEKRLLLSTADGRREWNGNAWVATDAKSAQKNLPTLQDGWGTLPLNDYRVLGAGPQRPESVSFSPLEHSGDAFLVRAIVPGHPESLAVVWSVAKRLVLLPGESSANAGAELAPGGKAVLLAGCPAAKTKASACLVNGEDGSMLRTFSEPSLARGAAAGILPDGSIVLFHGGHYLLRPLGTTFPDTPVWDDTTTHRPRALYAP